MTLSVWGVIATLAVIITSMTLMAAIYIYTKRKDKPKLPTTVKCITLGLFGLALLQLIGYATINTIALHHGMYDDKIPIQDVIYDIQHTHVEDKLPQNKDGALILYYRFDCEDCTELYDIITEQIAQFEETYHTKIYYVSTRSSQGVALRETYPVATVPSLLYIRKDSKENPIFLINALYDKNAEQPWNQTNWDNITSAWTADHT